MSEREEVLTEFGSAWRTTATDAMADEIVRLRSALTTAERERDEARRKREAMKIDHADALDAYRQMYESERDRAVRAERVVEAARDALRYGEHDGPCTNEDEWEDGPCTLHLAAAKQRRERLEAALRGLDATPTPEADA